MIDSAAFARTMLRAFGGRATGTARDDAGGGEGGAVREPWGAAMLRGEYALGWALYEGRLARRLAPLHGAYLASRWHGGPLDGRALTVLEAEGLGDALLLGRAYARLAERARAEGGAVSVVTFPPLVRLWAASFPDVELAIRCDLRLGAARRAAGVGVRSRPQRGRSDG